MLTIFFTAEEPTVYAFLVRSPFIKVCFSHASDLCALVHKAPTGAWTAEDNIVELVLSFPLRESADFLS